ncbi:TPA: hypothetical protein ACGW13_001472 [Stenotrophomonas maltophilia]|uniref:hypothetical protein n=1 Tax=Stenotrophomonas maltophilia TaxID=40324 RepID=UPI00066C3F9D|nr:hypothetical protein [Stenotrophomonas maltophilia]EKT4101704.1 hypothetical protein [Stenotrophomonas maltophilia]MBA0316159.1 hypothetical protein [Stenotrophomonas maltophilia]MBH1669180.1 hypothetical protein [Stenotrophomonas maltophilia]OWQ59783.1 hypothetical protein CEE59_05820 [Stenotrophomonas maltophilia]PZS83103.1 hypothetical protein A7X74_08075 [Stenotrophomonas maltophilia]
MLEFYTQSPEALLRAFKEKVDLGNEEGGISTWTVGRDGHFIHSSLQLKNIGYVSPKVINDGEEKKLRFSIYWRQETTAKEQQFCYKELSGNLLATFVDHFSNQFTKAIHTDVRKWA